MYIIENDCKEAGEITGHLNVADDKSNCRLFLWLTMVKNKKTHKLISYDSSQSFFSQYFSHYTTIITYIISKHSVLQTYVSMFIKVNLSIIWIRVSFKNSSWFWERRNVDFLALVRENKKPRGVEKITTVLVRERCRLVALWALNVDFCQHFFGQCVEMHFEPMCATFALQINVNPPNRDVAGYLTGRGEGEKLVPCHRVRSSNYPASH